MASREIPGIGGVHAFFDDGSAGYADNAGGVNASFIKFSVLSQLRVLDRVTASELAGLSPSQNDIYIVTDGTDATKIHARDNSAWFKITPKSGWIGFDVALDDFIWFDGTAWQEGLPGGGGGSETEALTINTQSGAYTLVLADAFAKYVRMTSATAVDLTIPANADEAIPIGSTVLVRNAGAGKISVVGDAGVTVNAQFGCTEVMAGQGASATLIKVATNTWDISGQFEAV